MADRKNFIQSLGVFLGGLATRKKSPEKKQEIEVRGVAPRWPNPHPANVSNLLSSSTFNTSATTTYTSTMEFKNEKKTDI